MNPRSPHPEPTPDSGYDSYVWPRSKTSTKQAIYDHLFAIGWRYDSVYAQWHTPVDAPLQGHGILELAADHSWARIQPASTLVNGQPVRPAPLLELTEDDYAVPES